MKAKEKGIIEQHRIEQHRKESILTCPEDCWCWKVENELFLKFQIKKEKDRVS